MKIDLLEILACPICKNRLTLTVDEGDDEEVVQGTLHCEDCHESYPIEDSIPNLLPPSLRG